jgi:hypothetical protein
MMGLMPTAVHNGGSRTRLPDKWLGVDLDAARSQWSDGSRNECKSCNSATFRSTARCLLSGFVFMASLPVLVLALPVLLMATCLRLAAVCGDVEGETSSTGIARGMPALPEDQATGHRPRHRWLLPAAPSWN